MKRKWIISLITLLFLIIGVCSLYSHLDSFAVNKIVMEKDTKELEKVSVNIETVSLS